MKFVGIAILVLLAALVIDAYPCVLFVIEIAQPVPVKRKEKPKCDVLCTAQYDPVCGGDPNDKSVKPRLFGNGCVMHGHNCEHKTNFVDVGLDKCGNAGGVRLS